MARRELFAEAIEQLDAYFARKLRAFELNLRPQGTPFQLRVWEALRAIPYGETRSYSDVARSIGKPDAVRAVGSVTVMCRGTTLARISPVETAH